MAADDNLEAWPDKQGRPQNLALLAVMTVTVT
jgi:hypothetical protein